MIKKIKLIVLLFFKKETILKVYITLKSNFNAFTITKLLNDNETMNYGKRLTIFDNRIEVVNYEC